jgi:hypothetical protein
MLKIHFLQLSIVATCGLLISCSEPAPKPVKPAKPDTAQSQATISITNSGVVHFEGIPQTGITAKEVLLLSSLNTEALTRLERQRELFEYTITGVNPELEEMNASLSSEDKAELSNSMAELKMAFPEQIIEDVSINQAGVDDDRLRKVPSDRELYDKYKNLFNAINWENLPRALEFITESINNDSRDTAETYLSKDAFTAKQAEITMEWLKSLKSHLNSYLSLGKAYVEAINRFSLKKADPKARTWDDYLAINSTQMIVDVSKNSLDSTFLSDDGSFSVEGEGLLIVRIEYGPRSAYFIPGNPSEKRVTVTSVVTE